MMRGALVVVLLGLAVGSLASPAATAQEAPRAPGVRLPPAYYERIRHQPDLFELKDGWIARARAAAERSSAVTGTLRAAVVLALFSNSREPHIDHEELQQVLFDGPYEYGTVTEFYDEASGGRFALQGQTFPWVRTSLTMQEVVGNEYGLGNDALTGVYLKEALDLIDGTADFGQFDNDGPDGLPNSGDDDGAVDAVAFEFLEVGASCGGPSIWPHRSRLEYWLGAAYATDDARSGGGAIVINDYIVQSVVDCGGTAPQTATTIAHEMAHVLGLPDLYDASGGLLPEQRRWIIGCWSLMAGGAWGCSSSGRDAWVRPTHMGPWERSRLGWLAAMEEADSAMWQDFTLEPMLSGERALRIPLERGEQADTNEYLIVEYRTKEGFDLDLPASGVLIYHIDPNVAGNAPCAQCPFIHRVALLEADGNDGLRRTFLQGGNRGEPGDVWGAPGPSRLTGTTYPSTRTHSGTGSGVSIDEITIQGGVARVTVSIGSVAGERLAQTFLGSAAQPLTAEERERLDRYGNRNGQYDVGDLRAHIQR